MQEVRDAVNDVCANILQLRWLFCSQFVHFAYIFFVRFKYFCIVLHIGFVLLLKTQSCAGTILWALKKNYYGKLLYNHEQTLFLEARCIISFIVSYKFARYIVIHLSRRLVLRTIINMCSLSDISSEVPNTRLVSVWLCSDIRFCTTIYQELRRYPLTQLGPRKCIFWKNAF